MPDIYILQYITKIHEFEMQKKIDQPPVITLNVLVLLNPETSTDKFYKSDVFLK